MVISGNADLPADWAFLSPTLMLPIGHNAGPRPLRQFRAFPTLTDTKLRPNLAGREERWHRLPKSPSSCPMRC
jgi:hypothetical protein